MNWFRKFQIPVMLLALASPLLAARESSAADAGQPDFSGVRKLIQEQMAADSTPSIALAVARKGKILWEEGFGWADLENRIPATERTMYYTASVTKTFTATAVMILQERGQIDLDRPINDYLGAAKLSSPAWNPADATVRRVATHTAGLTTFNPAHPLPIAEAIRRYGVIFWPPGDHFDYSNLGPIIIEEVVARVSGESYADFLRQEVLLPLGMTRASVGVGPGLEKYSARRYGADPKHSLRPPSDSGVYCSAHDLARFGMFHLKACLPDQKAVLSDEAIEAMQNSTVSTGDGEYGLAWWVDEDFHGFRSVLAQGGTDADQAWLRLIPSEDIAVAVLSNTGSYSLPAKIVDEILAILLPAYGEKRAIKDVAAAKPQPSGAKLPAKSFIGNWTGAIKTHRGDVPLTFSITESGDIHAQLGSQPATVLNHARFDQQQFAGLMPGDLGIDDGTRPTPTNLDFYLCLRNGLLTGAAVTDPSPQLPYWVELKKLGGGGPKH